MMTRDTPYYILGDDAFPPRTFLMKPYGRRGLDNDMMVANYRISRGRRVVENGLGILANRWRCFLGTLEQGPDVVRLLVDTGVILHHLLTEDQLPCHCKCRGGPGGWGPQHHPWCLEGRPTGGEIPQPQAPNRDNRVGKVMRDYLKAYFNSEAGSVPWQERLAGMNVNWLMTVDILMLKCFTICVISVYKCSFLPIKCSVYYFF